MKPFSSIAPDDPRLALIPDAPGRASAAPIAQPGPPRGYFIERSAEQRSPDRRASIERRRTLAACNPLPPAMAAKFTTSEQACAKVVGDEYLAHGVCDLSRNEIAARAGTCHTTAERFMLMIERLDWISVERRPRSGRKHLTNITRIISPEWLTWLARGNRKAAAVKSCTKAKPDFKTFRGVKKSLPRSPGFRSVENSRADPRVDVGKEALSERR